MITPSPTARDAGLTAVVTLPDQGTGMLKIRSQGGTVLAVVMLEKPAFHPVSLGEARARGLPLEAYGVAEGEATGFVVTDSTDTELWLGTVSAANGDGEFGSAPRASVSVPQCGS